MARRKRRSSRGRKQNKQNIYAVFMLLGVLLVGGGLLTFASIRGAEVDSIDKETFCQTDNLPEVLMIMIDASDSLDPVQKERALALILKGVKAVPERGRVDIYLMAQPGQKLAKPLFRKCNPGKAGSAITTNAKGDAKRFSVEFEGAIENALNDALSQSKADNSPLMESIRDAATSSYARAPDAANRRVIIISDMLQYSSVSSHYAKYDSVKELSRSPAWSSVLTDLGGADITIGYVTRPTDRALQGQKHLSWWENYFVNIGGIVRDVQTF